MAGGSAMKTTSNPVAKHLRAFNRPAVQRDRKKDDRRGYEKHRKVLT